MARNYDQYTLNFESNAVTKSYVDAITTGIDVRADGTIFFDGQEIQLQGLTYAADYTEHYSDRSLIDKGITMAKISTVQLDPKLLERLENVEKKVFGEYGAQKIKNKIDGSLDFENDVALFFQHDLNRKNWQNIFNDLCIDMSKEEILKISAKYIAPKEKKD